ncbi:hypothetical protein PoB_004694300 [Plakobranchus ocellatus]|uniref:Uncharacterized protein n=1 Tax=Plakobranchus ocellatus TaxID=259542 RepID=A0AAV4BLK0_9GAST|nr:hypothetical protein PoB_004694300 [Plakobranchus ocellatus]
MKRKRVRCPKMEWLLWTNLTRRAVVSMDESIIQHVWVNPSERQTLEATQAWQSDSLAASGSWEPGKRVVRMSVQHGALCS